MGKKVMNITFREFQIQIHKLGPSLFQVVRHLRYTYTISEIQIQIHKHTNTHIHKNTKSQAHVIVLTNMIPLR